jgi:hypothetical protein
MNLEDTEERADNLFNALTLQKSCSDLFRYYNSSAHEPALENSVVTVKY